MDKPEWPCALRIVHLIGGLRAINLPQDDEVRLYSCAYPHETIIGEFRIAEYSHLLSKLERLGLRPLGASFADNELQRDGVVPPDDRHFYRCAQHQSGWVAWDAFQTWRRIAVCSAREAANIPLFDLASRIAFELYACTTRWIELSDAYGDVLQAQIKLNHCSPGHRFETAYSYNAYLAIHALLSEISALRDYLAEFVAQHVLIHELPNNPHTKMGTLTSKGLRNRSDITHPAANTIKSITASGGWLCTLSAYRDIVTHHAPIHMTSGSNPMVVKELQIGGVGKVPYIESSLPVDPEAVKKERSRGTPMRSLKEWNRAFFDAAASGGPDALIYLHNAVGKLALLCLEMASYSPVRPKPIRLGSPCAAAGRLVDD